MLLNFVFNYIFIFVFHMGVVGAAIATTVIRTLELIVYLVCTAFKQKFNFAL